MTCGPLCFVHPWSAGQRDESRCGKQSVHATGGCQGFCGVSLPAASTSLVDARPRDGRCHVLGRSTGDGHAELQSRVLEFLPNAFRQGDALAAADLLGAPFGVAGHQHLVVAGAGRADFISATSRRMRCWN